jgi:hypothetical protein
MSIGRDNSLFWLVIKKRLSETEQQFTLELLVLQSKPRGFVGDR